MSDSASPDVSIPQEWTAISTTTQHAATAGISTGPAASMSARPPATRWSQDAPWDLPVGGTRVDSLTGLRWFAAFGVFLFHARDYFREIPWAEAFATIGYEGVPFFFILSGFVMTWVARPSDTAKNYYLRRFARIWPLLAVTTVGTVLLMKLWWHTPVSGQDIVWTLTFSQAWTTGHFMTMNVVTWTLSVEAFFYLAFPLILPILLRRSAATLALLGVVCVGLTAATRVAVGLLHHPAETERLLVASPLALTPMFVLGVCAGLLVRRGLRPPAGVGIAATLTAGTVLLCWFWTRHPDAVPYLRGEFGSFDAVLMPVFALLIATAALSDLRGTRSPLRSRPLVKLGEWSFAYYLCHVIVLDVFARLDLGPGPGLVRDTVEMTTAALAALVVAALLHECVEKPADRLLRRVLLPRRPSRRSSTPTT
ncbi:acyltransferase family protein [Streptomyces sp. NPDC090025]|uniref:acyltransferase family protein n=1 Tax=Streptomyces sp. NPDC090025 TaxID=3365922 RepID=UPI003835F6ED